MRTRGLRKNVIINLRYSSRNIPFLLNKPHAMPGKAKKPRAKTETVRLSVKALETKNAGMPIAIPMPKQIACLFVKPKINFCLIRLKSLGIRTKFCCIFPPFNFCPSGAEVKCNEVNVLQMQTLICLMS